MNPVSRFFSRVASHFGCPCSEVHKLLFDYAQGNLDAEKAKRLEKHISDCPPCLEFVESYKKTVTACREHGKATTELPPELKKKLCDFIEKEL